MNDKAQKQFEKKCSDLADAVINSFEYYLLKAKDPTMTSDLYEESMANEVYAPDTYIYPVPVEILERNKLQRQKNYDIIDAVFSNKYFTKAELLTFTLDFLNDHLVQRIIDKEQNKKQ